MSPKRPAGDPLPPVKRADGLKKVRGLALKLVQQQLMDMRDRRLMPAEREFILNAYKVLSAVAKPAPKAPKTGAKASESDPLALLGE